MERRARGARRRVSVWRGVVRRIGCEALFGQEGRRCGIVVWFGSILGWEGVDAEIRGLANQMSERPMGGLEVGREVGM